MFNEIVHTMVLLCSHHCTKCTKYENCAKVKDIKLDLLQDTSKPVMCSYKGVRVSFEVWGLQSKVESYAHKVRIKITKFIFKANVQAPRL